MVKDYADREQESVCGWCKDKFGLSWQVAPAVLGELMSNPESRRHVVQAFMKMRKFDMEALQNAWGLNHIIKMSDWGDKTDYLPHEDSSGKPVAQRRPGA